jgi:hypothetical protein
MNEHSMLIDACEKAALIVSQAEGMDQLYDRAIRFVGEGQLRLRILDRAVDAIQNENMSDEVFVSDESMLSFFCGIWIQYLLTEIAGVKKEKLRAFAQKVFSDLHETRSVH